MDKGLVGLMTPIFYSEKVSAEAGAWLARLQSGDISSQDETAFQSWVTADPAHAAAFEHATNVWNQLGSIPRELYLPQKKPATMLSRRAVMAGAVTGLAALGSSFFFLRGAQARNYETVVGEQRRIPLADGSVLFLDTNTSLSVDLSGSRRLVDLKYGRVNFRVTPSDRQFSVTAGDRMVIGNHSVFDVFNARDYFSVVLIDGDAQVSSSAGAPIELRQGDRLTATEPNSLHRDRPDLSVLTAWQTGHLIFRNQPVSEIVDQVNRYSTVKIEVDDSNIASLHMSGGYVVGDTVGFAESLSQLLPIEVRFVEGKIKLTNRQNI
jgi:transmembrane sensor